MTATATEPDTEQGAEMVEYTVLVGAVTIDTGRANPHNKSQREVVRLTQGQTITAPADNETILTLVSLKSIRPTSEVTGKERVTARTLLKAFQEQREEARMVEEVVPVDAPLPVTDPNDL